MTTTIPPTTTVAARAVAASKIYGTGDTIVRALDSINVEFPRAEYTAIMGPSGSGKSTLLACLAGLDEPDGGSVSIDGTRISRRPEEERASIRGARIGMLFQQANLVGHLSIADNVALAQRMGGGSRAGDWRDELLQNCGIEHRATARPAQLSGGELARAGLAVALANDPPVILADEPTGELDSVTAARVLDLLRARAAAGAGVLIVTHSPEVAASADREVRLLDGRVEL